MVEARRRHAAARRDRGRTRTSRRAPRCGCSCRRSAAARWLDRAGTRAAGMRPRGRNDDGADVLPARRAARLRARSALGACRAASVRAAAPPPTAITPELIEAAQEGRQGRLVHLDRPAARREDRQGVRGEISRHRGARRAHRRRARVPAHRPGICQPHPCGRRGQLVGRRAFHRLEARRLARALRARGRGASTIRAEHKDPDGLFASFRVRLSLIGYNTNLVKAEDAPKSFADLLDPKWAGKIVKAHPGYSGTIMTATYQIVARPRLGLSSRSSPSRTSCRCSRRPIRRRSSRSASAP